jgi:hypothetical protein
MNAGGVEGRYVLTSLHHVSWALTLVPQSHHWSRELQALGQTVRLMPPAYEPYVKRRKNDATDAGRSAKLSSSMRFAEDQNARVAELLDAQSHASSPDTASLRKTHRN